MTAIENLKEDQSSYTGEKNGMEAVVGGRKALS
jgi:hypothetical protein